MAVPETTSASRARPPPEATTIAGESLLRSSREGSEALAERRVTRRPASTTTAAFARARVREMPARVCLYKCAVACAEGAGWGPCRLLDSSL